MLHYEERIKGKSSEEILQTAGGTAWNVVQGPEGEYYRLAAQVRSTQELTEALKNASASSDVLSTRVFRLNGVLALLTLALVVVGLCGALATAWPYLAWWWQHR
jgi:hypothetical protein